MKEVAEWLMRVEKLSGKFYRDAALFFEDPGLVAFLERCAGDEARHADIIHKAVTFLVDHPEITPPFRVDQHIKDAIEVPFRQNQNKLHAGTLTRPELIDGMVATEFSEWNDIFLYVVNALQTINPDFKSAAAELQNHLKHMERFLATTEYGQKKIEALKSLAPVWQERILIVEDDRHLAELFASVLHAQGQVDVARDGQTGLAKIQERYYRLIVSDVDMPDMDGIALFRQAAERFASIGDRYLFLTGNPSPEIMAFFEIHHLRYLTKPASIHDLQSAALAILDECPAN